VISYTDFYNIDIRIGKIIEINDFPKAKSPSYKLKIDFGALGIKKSCAQVTTYKIEDLLNKQVVCVVNLPPKQVAITISEVLVLGALTKENGIALLTPEKEALVGTKIF